MSRPLQRRRRVPFLVLLALSFCAAHALPRGAHAQDAAHADAREQFRIGIELFNTGRYAEAEQSFARGYALSHKPGFLWNMAESARSAGANARALELYRRYLAEAEPDAPRLEDARRWIRELEAAAAAQPAPGAADPLSPSAAAAAGHGHKPQDAGGGVSWNASVAQPPRDAGEPVYEKWWFWTGAGAIVAAGVITAVLLANSDDPQGELVDWKNPPAD